MKLYEESFSNAFSQICHTYVVRAKCILAQLEFVAKFFATKLQIILYNQLSCCDTEKVLEDSPPQRVQKVL